MAELKKYPSMLDQSDGWSIEARRPGGLALFFGDSGHYMTVEEAAQLSVAILDMAIAVRGKKRALTVVHRAALLGLLRFYGLQQAGG